MPDIVRADYRLVRSMVFGDTNGTFLSVSCTGGKALPPYLYGSEIVCLCFKTKYPYSFEARREKVKAPVSWNVNGIFQINC